MKKNDLIFILISAFILIVAWVVFNIYHNANASTIMETTSVQIEPINPIFDTNTIDALKQREKISPAFVLQATSPTPTIASQSAETTATQSAL